MSGIGDKKLPISNGLSTLGLKRMGRTLFKGKKDTMFGTAYSGAGEIRDHAWKRIRRAFFGTD